MCDVLGIGRFFGCEFKRFCRMIMRTCQIEINEQFKKALAVMENTRKNVFITGKAGTGKSTLLDYYRSITSKKSLFLPLRVSPLSMSRKKPYILFLGLIPI